MRVEICERTLLLCACPLFVRVVFTLWVGGGGKVYTLKRGGKVGGGMSGLVAK